MKTGERCKTILWGMGLGGMALIVCSLLIPFSVRADTAEPTVPAVPVVEEIAQNLVGAKLRDVPDVLEALEATRSPQILPLFHAMLNGQLYYRKSDQKIVIAEQQSDKSYQLTDALTASPLGAAEKAQIKKIRVNNRLRSHLRAAIARLSLVSEDQRTRLEAVSAMLEKPNAQSTALLLETKQQETDPEVLQKIELALALADIHSDDENKRTAALEVMSGSLEPAVRNAVLARLETNADGTFVEPNDQIRARASAVLESIESQIRFYGFLEQIFFGLSMGSVLLLIATGLAITFGVMGVINMAHGELIMLGAYTTYVVQLLMPGYIDYSIFVAIPAAFIVAGSVGVLIERGVIRFLLGRPLETLLATFGVSLILQQSVRTIFSPLNRQVATPSWMSGSLEINAVLSLTYNRLFIIIFALMVFTALLVILKRTSLGLYVRAVSQNRDMAKAMGVRSEWVDAMTFGLGSGIAGLAGVALSQLTNVGPNLGQSYIIDSFMVVVFGGAGNLWGTLVGGSTLGVTNKFLEPLTGPVLANILVLIFIILFIQVRPRGLFPQKGRAADT